MGMERGVGSSIRGFVRLCDGRMLVDWWKGGGVVGFMFGEILSVVGIRVDEAVAIEEMSACGLRYLVGFCSFY